MTIKIHYIDPVSGPEMLQPLADYLAPLKSPDAEIELVCLRPGLPYDNLEYHSFEALVSGDIVKAVYDASQNGFDAVVIGCFYDLCLMESREIAGDCIVTAPCQSSLQIASTLANRVSILIGREKWRHKMSANIHHYGYQQLVGSLVSAGKSVDSYVNDPEASYQSLLKAAQQAIREDGAEAVVLGCSANFGMHTKLQQGLGVPVIDPALAALVQAEHHARLKQQHGWSTSHVGSLESPLDQPGVREYFTAKQHPIGQTVWVK